MSVTSRPLVSILIPAYNAREWVATAIESALAQTWENREIILLDDGSTDGSAQVINHFADRIVVKRTPNGGQNVARNRLTALSRGDWLVYLDADDELAVDSVERKMKHSSDADVVYGSMDVAEFRERDLVVSHKVVADDYPDPIVAAFRWKFPNTSACAFRREALRTAGGWDETVKNCTDYALYFPLLHRQARFKAAPDSWSIYRQWSLTQAVNEDPLRRTTTRLSVMRVAAELLREGNELTREREQAFLDASLGVIRTIFAIDRPRALDEHRRLRQWNGRFRPSSGVFPARYRAAYRTIGFALTERLAALVRRSTTDPWYSAIGKASRAQLKA